MPGCFTDNENACIVRIIVNEYREFENQEILYSLRAKKEEADAKASKAFSLFSSSTLKVTGFLDFVKEYFPNELSENVA